MLDYFDTNIMPESKQYEDEQTMEHILMMNNKAENTPDPFETTYEVRKEG